MDDKRFNAVLTDRKFRNIPKNERKVKIDNRFKSMFTGKQFKVKYTVDKRGRPINYTSTDDLKRYYELSSEQSSEEESEDEENISEKQVKTRTSGENEEVHSSASDTSDGKNSDNEDKEDSDADTRENEIINELNLKHKSDQKVPDKIKKKLKNLKVDYARGEGVLMSESSSDDEESETDESESEDIDHKWGELDGDAERTDDVTYRLAACNMDWDRIHATDLMVLFNSFVPPGGIIKSIHIYPSEFGLQRMKEEEVKGPIELVNSKLNNENAEETEEGSKYHMEKLRQYQLNRLKYYYAVITCDSKNTANKIYTECDGMEYESSATKIDLRFIPNDMIFEQEPKEICDKLPDLTKYQPRFFTTTALQQAKVDLTWDETDPGRIEFAQKLASGKVDEIDDDVLQNYVAASDTEEDDENEEEKDVEDSNDEESNPISKYRALLQEIQEKEEEKKNKQIEMEVEWNPDQKHKAEEMVKQKINENENKTPFEKYLDKRKEKRKEKREQRKKNMNQEKSDNSDSDIPSDIDMNDPYFAEEFNNSEFKKKSNEKKINKSEEDEDEKQKQAELELLLLDEEDGKKHFSLKTIQEQENLSKSKKKRKMKKNKEEVQTDDFEVDVNDERFSALYSSHAFNIDPSDPQFKKTKNMEKVIAEKLKRKAEITEEKEENIDVKRPKAALSALVKTVKSKTEAFKNKKR